MEEEKQHKGIIYKINENGKYYVKATQWQDKIFYSVTISQKMPDGTFKEYQRNLFFNKCEPPKNGDCIKILDGFESNYANKKDPFNCITSIVVNEWELVEKVIEQTNEAITEYQNKQSEQNIEITASDLPF